MFCIKCRLSNGSLCLSYPFCPRKQHEYSCTEELCFKPILSYLNHCVCEEMLFRIGNFEKGERMVSQKEIKVTMTSINVSSFISKA